MELENFIEEELKKNNKMNIGGKQNLMIINNLLFFR